MKALLELPLIIYFVVLALWTIFYFCIGSGVAVIYLLTSRIFWISLICVGVIATGLYANAEYQQQRAAEIARHERVNRITERAYKWYNTNSVWNFDTNTSQGKAQDLVLSFLKFSVKGGDIKILNRENFDDVEDALDELEIILPGNGGNIGFVRHRLR